MSAPTPRVEVVGLPHHARLAARAARWAARLVSHDTSATESRVLVVRRRATTDGLSLIEARVALLRGGRPMVVVSEVAPTASESDAALAHHAQRVIDGAFAGALRALAEREAERTLTTGHGAGENSAEAE